ncbi:MAG: plasmid maintenance system killer protein [Planctomycetota bacterium]|nr:MAG: plasmid maintenance system killer protein [Planctomycetota bacterium]
MKVRFRTAKYERLYRGTASGGGWDHGIVKSFRMRIQFLEDIDDERSLRSMKAWRYEKLSGKRSHQRSIRLNDQWRLIIELEQEDGEKVVVVHGIEDYH